MIVDQLTKNIDLLAIYKSSLAEKLANLYVLEIVARHGILVSILSDQYGRHILFLTEVP